MQKLYERLKDRKDVQLVTLNVDDNVGLIAPFMKENKYTFPVIPAQLLMQDLVPSLGIPLTWILDAGGVVRQETVGFGGDAEKWVDQMVEAIEKVKGGISP